MRCEWCLLEQFIINHCLNSCLWTLKLATRPCLIINTHHPPSGRVCVCLGVGGVCLERAALMQTERACGSQSARVSAVPPEFNVTSSLIISAPCASRTGHSVQDWDCCFFFHFVFLALIFLPQREKGKAVCLFLLARAPFRVRVHIWTVVFRSVCSCAEKRERKRGEKRNEEVYRSSRKGNGTARARLSPYISVAHERLARRVSQSDQHR